MLHTKGTHVDMWWGKTFWEEGTSKHEDLEASSGSLWRMENVAAAWAE